MVSLTFGEQVKIVLSRKGMTIKELAETIQERTGNKMSRQNLTQRLGRDNFQEQDMRMIAEILGCPFQLSILGTDEAGDVPADRGEAEQQRLIVAGSGKHKKAEQHESSERDITIGELVEMQEEIAKGQEAADEKVENIVQKPAGEVLTEEKPAPIQELHTPERTVRYINTDALREARKGAAKGQTVPEEPKRKPVTSVIKEYIKKPILKRVFEEEKEEDKPAEAAAEEIQEVKTAVEIEPAKKPVETVSVTETAPSAEEAASAENEVQEPAVPVSEGAERTESEHTSVRPEESRAASAAPVKPQEPAGDINPYTGKEYETNSVRMHPKRIGYVQVYDRTDHKWTDMTEWAFLGYQERKKAMLGADYEPPIYLD